MQYAVFLIIFLLTACSSGSKGNIPVPNGNVGFSEFNESSISLSVGCTTQVTVSFRNSTRQPNPSSFYVWESNVVTLNPSVCTLDFNNNPPTCMTTITAVGIGVTKISATFGPGQPLTVTVTDDGVCISQADNKP